VALLPGRVAALLQQHDNDDYHYENQEQAEFHVSTMSGPGRQPLASEITDGHAAHGIGKASGPSTQAARRLSASTLRVVQTFELLAFYAIVAVTAFLLRDRLRSLGDAPVGWRLAGGFVLGAALVLPLLAKGVDVVPDGLEPLVFAALVAVLVFLVWLSIGLRP